MGRDGAHPSLPSFVAAQELSLPPHGPLVRFTMAGESSGFSADKSLHSLTSTPYEPANPLQSTSRSFLKASLVLTRLVLLTSSLLAGDSKDYPNVAEWKLKDTGYHNPSERQRQQ
jgi:hypothetical protein